MNVEKGICLGCNCINECLDQNADAVLWINDYYMNKAKQQKLYSDNVVQYVLPKFWQTQEDFCSAKDYCLMVNKTIIAELAEQLDMIHNTCLGKKGWDVILWHWLESYIEAFYDKYIRVKYAIEKYPSLYLKESNIWYIPRENVLYENEVLQAQQYKDIYDYLYCNDASADQIGIKCKIIQSKLPEEKRKREAWSIKHMVAEKLKVITCRREVTLYLCTQYLNISKTLLEILSQGRITRMELPYEKKSRNNLSIDMRKRIKRSIDYGDEFINLVYDYFWKHIPMEFVEDFCDFCEAYGKLELKTQVKIVDSTMIYNNILFKIFVADAINHGGKLEMIQHGGNYCLEKYIRWWEFEMADKYYTWGNGFVANNRGNMYAMPLPKILSVKKRKKKNILFVGYAHAPYVGHFWNLYGMKCEEVYRIEDFFFQKLQRAGRESLRVRCYPVDPWWERKDSLRQKFSWMQFDHNVNYYTSMAEAKLIVSSIISTTCMESINCNIPTIIFCSEDFFIPDENAVEILNELRRVKVLFDNPEDAANFINNNLESIDRWWNESERKMVVGRFRNMYASRGHFPKLKWIREMLKESKKV